MTQITRADPCAMTEADMQPQRASRGIAAVAMSSAACGFLLLLLVVLLTACGASSSGTPATTTSASPSGTAASSTAPSAPTSAGSATTGSSPAGTAPATSTAPTDDTVPTVPVTTAPAVPLTAAAPATGGGSITIGAITSLQGTAQLPGEIAGPAVRVPVTITNGAAAPINLSQVVVDLVDSSGVSAGPLSTDPAVPFSGSLAAGATANGVYVFSLATDDRRDIRIVVTYTTAAPVVVFSGTIA